MKLLSTKLGTVFLVMGLALGCGNAWGADWKEFAEAGTGSFYFDTASISSPSEGIVRVWIHNAARYETSLVEFRCKAGNYEVLDHIEYDEAGRMKGRYLYYDNPTRVSIPPRSVAESLHAIVCP